MTAPRNNNLMRLPRQFDLPVLSVVTATNTRWEVSLDDKEAETIGKLMAKATRLAISGQIDKLPAIHAAIGLTYMEAIERWVEELVEDKVNHSHLTELEAAERLLEVYA